MTRKPDAPLLLPRLSLMMFLEFFIWGAWFVTIGVYLRQGVDFSAGIGTAYSVGPIAAIIAPVFLGLLADRFLPTQVVLGILHLIGGGIMLMVPWSIQQELGGREGLFFWVLLGYMLCYMPTLGLTNTLAMRNIEDSEKQFPVIRVFGTIGWIAAGFLVGTILKADATALPLQIAAGSSFVLGVFSFFLPNTPPVSRGKKPSLVQALGLESLGMLKDLNFLVFALASLLICIPLQAYYAYAATFITDAGFGSAAGTMFWGQISEIFFMLIIPLLFARLGVKWMLAIGMACWVLRYALFAVAAPDSVKWMIFTGILLHGICYDFFFVTGQIYTDKKAPEAIRGQAQGFLVVLTQGIGMYLGAKLNDVFFTQKLAGATGADALAKWPAFWWIPAMMAGGILLVFLAVFRDRMKPSVDETLEEAAQTPEVIQ
ncbi:nucleoside permease [Haloferula rosea]|uniref:Nucleoside permease n=1 Tax=Haloferula rosea TaxID=490093 RepID=A0A934R9L9_9BACT|nr:nucleoside permease [Haloferula rosea]MBK1826538.1 nucleoside permease [Haloferula rosea]